MRVLLSTYGSRGDVEPMAALAVALRGIGVEAVVCAPADPEFLRLLDRAEVPLAPAFMPVRPWIDRARRSGWDLPRAAAEMAARQYEAVAAAAEGCDAIVATGLFPSIAAAQTVAEVRDVPYVWTAFCPVILPSPHHPPLAYPGHPHPPGVTDNHALWDHNDAAMNALFGRAVNGLRASVGLPELDRVRDHVFTRRPWLAADPLLGPWPGAAELEVVQTGAWVLPDDRPLPAELEAFLAAGESPVYVGFGSMGMPGVADTAHVAVEAARARGRRVILARGWADAVPADGRDDVLAVALVNQLALFPPVAALVPPGGAGSTFAAAPARWPQVVVPRLADQPYWAERVAALGVGLAHDGPVATLDSLSAGLAVALSSEAAGRASGLAGVLRADGAAGAARGLGQLTGLQGPPVERLSAD